MTRSRWILASLAFLTLSGVSCTKENPLDSLGDPTEIPKIGLPVNVVGYIAAIEPGIYNPKALRLYLALETTLVAPGDGVITKVSNTNSLVTIKIFHSAYISSEVSGYFSTTRRVGDKVKDTEILGSGLLITDGVTSGVDFTIYYDNRVFCYYSFLDDESRQIVNTTITNSPFPCF